MKCLSKVDLEQDEQDRPWWSHDSKGKYTVKSFSKAIWDQHSLTNNVRSVWYGLAPLRAELLAWFIVLQ